MEKTIYCGSIWWRDCDPFLTIAGYNSCIVGEELDQAMQDAAKDAFDGAEPEEKETVADYLNGLCASGVHAYTPAELGLSQENIRDLEASEETIYLDT